jgi:glucose-6-phosphate isomerase
LFANALAQSQAMMQGKTLDEVRDELTASGMKSSDVEALAPHKVIPGNRPNNMIVPEKITPEVVGALVALYEQKVLVQGTLWQINSFDQWGVELGKVLGNQVYDRLKEKGGTSDQDSSTNGLVNRFKQLNR